MSPAPTPAFIHCCCAHPLPDSPNLQAVSDRLVQLILLQIGSYGPAGDVALHAVRAFRSLVHGFASLEIAGGFALALSRDESFEILIDIFLRGIQAKGTAQAFQRAKA